MDYILTIAGIHLVACLSPGPDIFLVVLNSLRHDWKTGLATTTGILSGVTLQIAFGLTGVSYLMTRGPVIEHSIALAGGTWLVHLGLKGLRNWRPRRPRVEDNADAAAHRPAFREAWSQGLLVNVLNPKAILYFLSLFSVLLGPGIAISTRILCGLILILVQAVAFSVVAVLTDRPFFKARWSTLQAWLDRSLSLILFGLGLWIWIETLAAVLD